MYLPFIQSSEHRELNQSAVGIQGVATLPSETNIDAGINVTITSLLCLCIICYILMLYIAFNHLHRLIWAE